MVKQLKVNGLKATLSIDELQLIKRVIAHPDVRKFKDIAKVDVGIVTGPTIIFLLIMKQLNYIN